MILVLSFYAAMMLAFIPVALARRHVRLESIYENPRGARRLWWFRTPGPMALLLAWYLIPAGVMAGYFGLTKLGFFVDKGRVAQVEEAAAQARAKVDAQKKASIEAIRQEYERKRKGKRSFWSSSPEELDSQEKAEISQRAGLFEAQAVKAEAFAREQKTKELTPARPKPPSEFARAMVFLLMAWSVSTVVGLVVAWKAFRKNRTRGGFHGFARWSSWGEVVCSEDHRWVIPIWVAYRSTTRAWKLWERWIGRIGLAPFAPPEGDAVNTHYLLIGASGSGKGAAIFSHIMATSRTPVIYQDEKAECPLINTPKWKGAIRWGCAAEGGWPSMRWNPMEECRRDKDPVNAFRNLASVLLPDAEGENAWIPKLARPIIAEMLMSGRWETIGKFADDIRDFAFVEICDAVKMASGVRASLDGRNVKEYLVTTLFSELDAFRIGWGRQVTSGHDFSLDELIDRGGYILGAETEEDRRTPIRLMWSLLLRRLMRSAKPRPVSLLMDEAKKAGKIPHMAEALVTLRSRGVSIWSAWQSESLIYSVYGKEEGQAVVDSFGNRVTLLHGISVRDAETLSKASGNWSKRRGGHLSFGMSAGGPSVTGTTGPNDETAIPLITATDILNRSRLMEDRWAIISARGGAKKGNLIIARLIPGEAWTEAPTPSQVEAEHRRIYGEATSQESGPGRSLGDLTQA